MAYEPREYGGGRDREGRGRRERDDGGAGEGGGHEGSFVRGRGRRELKSLSKILR